MHDQRGIKRSFCTECTGDENCQEFERSEKTPFCGYCGCPPIKHKRVEIDDSDSAETIKLFDVPDAVHDTVSVSNKAEVLEIEDISQKEKETENINPLELPELPQFSKCVENALENGSIHGSLWSNMIMQCAVYYTKFDVMKTKTHYEQVGRSMFEKYPCIEGPGSKPWSAFTKCLSQKIRTERMKIKGFKLSVEKKHFDTLTNLNGGSHKKQASAEKRTFFRSEANLTAQLSSESEIAQAREKIGTEWTKESPEKGVIKSLLRDTFTDRSNILKNGASFDVFLENYPCFKDDSYVLYEFSILLGRNKVVDLSNNMKEFFGKLQSINKSGSTEGDAMLSNWLWFEKKCGIFCTKNEKSSPIVEVVLDHADYNSKLSRHSDFPIGVLFLNGSDIKDCALVYGHHFIKCSQLSILSLLTLLVAVYYILELNYPKRHMQAMGALAAVILNHKYYKLGQSAIQMLRLIK